MKAHVTLHLLVTSQHLRLTRIVINSVPTGRCTLVIMCATITTTSRTLKRSKTNTPVMKMTHSTLIRLVPTCLANLLSRPDPSFLSSSLSLRIDPGKYTCQFVRAPGKSQRRSRLLTSSRKINFSTRRRHRFRPCSLPLRKARRAVILITPPPCQCP